MTFLFMEIMQNAQKQNRTRMTQGELAL